MGPLSAAAIWGLCLVLLARSSPSGVFSFASIYLLLLGLFHLGLVVPLALGLELPSAERPDWLSSPQLPLSLGLVAVAMLAFTLGAGLAPRRAAPAPPSAVPTSRGELYLAGLAVAALGATLLLKGAVELGVFSSGYGTFFERMLVDDVRLLWMGLMLFPIGVLIAAAGATRRQMLVVGLVLVGVLAPLFLSGFRGPVIVHVASLLAVWAHKDRRLARGLGVALFAAALVLAPAIRAARAGSDDESPDARARGPLAVVLEAGGSLHPLVVTAERIGTGAEGPWGGRSYAIALGRVMLNVSSRRSSEEYLTPSAWATLQADEWAYENGYGIGFSGVAEPYLNFGFAGILVVFLALGMVVRTWERWLARDPYLAAIGAASFGFVLWTVRNEALEVFRAMAIAAGTVLGAMALATLRRRWSQRPGGTG